jgi:type II secretory pathway component PulM
VKEKWSSLSKRDKFMLIIGITFFSCYLIYLFVLAPLDDAISQLTTETKYQHELLHFMKNAQKIRQTHKKKPIKQVEQNQLLSVISASLKRANIEQFPHQLQQTANGKVRLTFKAIPFDLLFTWMILTWEKNALELDKFNATKIQNQGYVSTELLLSTKN